MVQGKKCVIYNMYICMYVESKYKNKHVKKISLSVERHRN